MTQSQPDFYRYKFNHTYFQSYAFFFKTSGILNCRCYIRMVYLGLYKLETCLT